MRFESHTLTYYEFSFGVRSAQGLQAPITTGVLADKAYGPAEMPQRFVDHRNRIKRFCLSGQRLLNYRMNYK
jgi:hypothetical protein